MGHHEHHPVEVDPQTLAESNKLWHGFTAMAKYGVIGVVVLLTLMAVFLL
jgi:hypothetical protein